MEKTNINYLQCSDCGLSGNTGMIFGKGNYNCVKGYNDCKNVELANQVLESGRTISGFSDIRNLESELLKNQPDSMNDISPPDTTYNNSSLFSASRRIPAGKSPETICRLFPDK